MGVTALRAAAVSLQDRPAIEPESSIKKIVSKLLKNAYGLSAAVVIGPGTMAAEAGGLYAGGGAEDVSAKLLDGATKVLAFDE